MRKRIALTCASFETHPISLFMKPLRPIHRNLAEGVIQCLEQVMFRGAHADKYIPTYIRSNRLWGKRDRHFVASYSYDIIRWWRKVIFLSGIDEKRIINHQRLWQLLGTWVVVQNTHELPEWEEFSKVDVAGIQERQKNTIEDLSIAESIPKWMQEWGSKQLGEQWPEIVSGLNQEAKVYIRVNSLLTTPERLLKAFERDMIEAALVEGYPDALVLNTRRRLGQSHWFRKGLFEFQDLGSQAIAPFLEVDQLEAGAQIIDACAGAGGKTLHLSALSKGKASILALDIERRKLSNLNERVRRSQSPLVKVRAIEGPKTLKPFQGKADRLLLDVPCSNTGTLRRHPDLKWKLQPEEIAATIKTQAKILDEYQSLLKVGGKMVYATCSIFPSENKGQIRRFLDDHKNFSLEDEKQFFPHEGPTDGFYMARLKKNA